MAPLNSKKKLLVPLIRSNRKQGVAATPFKAGMKVCFMLMGHVKTA